MGKHADLAGTTPRCRTSNSTADEAAKVKVCGALLLCLASCLDPVTGMPDDAAAEATQMLSLVLSHVAAVAEAANDFATAHTSSCMCIRVCQRHTPPTPTPHTPHLTHPLSAMSIVLYQRAS